MERLLRSKSNTESVPTDLYVDMSKFAVEIKTAVVAEALVALDVRWLPCWIASFSHHSKLPIYWSILPWLKTISCDDWFGCMLGASLVRCSRHVQPGGWLWADPGETWAAAPMTRHRISGRKVMVGRQKWQKLQFLLVKLSSITVEIPSLLSLCSVVFVHYLIINKMQQDHLFPQQLRQTSAAYIMISCCRKQPPVDGC